MIMIGYLSSLLMGLSLGLIGGGGSILTVPILVYFFSVNPVIATSESLFVVGSTALIGGLIAYKNKEVNLLTVIQFAAPSFVGVYLMKKIILPFIPDTVFMIDNFAFTKPLLVMIVFAFLMIVVSYTMMRQKKLQASNIDQNSANKLGLILQGFFVGNVTGFVGAGGGFLIVPALVNLIGLNMRSAIGSSLMIIAANSLFGFILSLSAGLAVNWNILLSVLAISIVGLIFGRFFSTKISENKLKKGFGFFVLVMGSIILIDQVFALIK